jgi:hypothetical protein
MLLIINDLVMKKAAILFFVIILIPLSGFNQTIDQVDHISPFNDGVAAIKNGDLWAFINDQGDIVVNFRDDLVSTKINNGKYPIFNDGRCLITQKKEGIIYYGYIDKTGNSVIAPQFLNATNFNNNTAIVLELVEKTRGNNNVLRKPVVTHVYFEVVINTAGEIMHYLTQKPKHITLDKDFIKQPIKITTRLLSDNAFAIRDKTNTWEIKKIE